MVAVQGVYENGRIQLAETAPMEKAQVIVIFPEGRSEVKAASKRSARKIFDEFTGSIKREIDEKAELMAARDDKYADID